MVTVDFDNPDSALAFLSKALRPIHEALDHGLSFADQVIAMMTTTKGKPWLRADIARNAGRDYLESMEKQGWGLGRVLQNGGIEVVCYPAVLRVLKSQDGITPHPGLSGARQEYWSQKQLQFPMFGLGVVAVSGSNLIVEWDIDSDQQILLALAKPVGVWDFKCQPKLAWRKRVVPSDGDDGGMKFVPAEEDLTLETLFDVDELDGDADVG